MCPTSQIELFHHLSLSSACYNFERQSHSPLQHSAEDKRWGWDGRTVTVGGAETNQEWKFLEKKVTNLNENNNNNNNSNRERERE